jgi:hypothetical protein
LKCDKCGYVSYDHNLTCPACSKELSVVRSRLGSFLDPPETTFDLFFADASGLYRTVPPASRGGAREAELEMDTGGEEFEFSLDD